MAAHALGTTRSPYNSCARSSSAECRRDMAEEAGSAPAGRTIHGPLAQRKCIPLITERPRIVTGKGYQHQEHHHERRWQTGLRTRSVKPGKSGTGFLTRPQVGQYHTGSPWTTSIKVMPRSLKPAKSGQYRRGPPIWRRTPIGRESGSRNRPVRVQVSAPPPRSHRPSAGHWIVDPRSGVRFPVRPPSGYSSAW